MTQDRDNLSEKRRTALEHLRERRFEMRRARQDGQLQSAGSTLEYFIRLQDESEDEYPDSLPVETESSQEQLAEIRHRLKQAKQLERQQKHLVQPQEEQPSVPRPEPEEISSRLNFVGEVLSNHFKNNLASWVTNVDPEPELSSTPLEDIEELRQEVRYRHKMLSVMLEATQKELDALEVYIRATKACSSPSK